MIKLLNSRGVNWNKVNAIVSGQFDLPRAIVLRYNKQTRIKGFLFNSYQLHLNCSSPNVINCVNRKTADTVESSHYINPTE